MGEKPRRTIRQMLPVQFTQARIEIIVHQRDREVGRTFQDAHAQLGQRGAKFSGTSSVNRLNAHRAVSKIVLGDVGRQPKARPIRCRNTGGGARCSYDETAVQKTLQRFVDFIGRKIPRQQANELPKSFAALANRRNEIAIELAVKKEFAILGIEAHDIGRQQIDGEIRRQLGKVFVTVRRETGHPIARHDSPARTPLPPANIAALQISAVSRARKSTLSATTSPASEMLKRGRALAYWLF